MNSGMDSTIMFNILAANANNLSVCEFTININGFELKISKDK